MRNRLVTLLILLMVALPVWSASTVCCHMQKVQQSQAMPEQHCQHASTPLSTSTPLSDHTSTPLSEQAASGDNCQCDQFQHSQFVLSLPELPLLQPTPHFAPEISIPAPLAERHETIIRPPIA
ncbi:MAG: hypothetical protein KJ914_03200 [Gammaproteobacteria bacterium]|nr:hypothetical protein [Gammaproteobacteria bacterium]